MDAYVCTCVLITRVIRMRVCVRVMMNASTDQCKPFRLGRSRTARLTKTARTMKTDALAPKVGSRVGCFLRMMRPYRNMDGRIRARRCRMVLLRRAVRLGYRRI